MGEYVSLLGDDDFLLPMAVEHLLDTLEKKARYFAFKYFWVSK